MSDVFISYSRKDGDFARRLTNELASPKLNRDVWIDWQDIPHGADWLNEIYAGIESADAFVVIIGPHSLTSEICNTEIAHARKFNKRIIPVVRQRIEGDVEKIVKGTWVDESWGPLARENWEAIRHVNWLLFDDDRVFETNFNALLETLDEDLPHRKAHTRYLVRALDWERNAHNPSYLLMGDEITLAEKWLADSAGKNPPADSLHHNYISASRQAEDARNARIAAMEKRTRELEAQTEAAARENTRLAKSTRRFRLAAALLTVVGVLAGSAALLSYNAAGEALVVQRTAVAREGFALTQVALAGQTLTPIPPTLTAVSRQIVEGENLVESLRLAARASQLLQENGDAQTAALLGIRALKIAFSPQAEAALVEALKRPFTRLTLSDDCLAVHSAALSPDSRYVLTGCDDSSAQLWSTDTGVRQRVFSGHNEAVSRVAFSPDGRYALTGSLDGSARLWVVETGETASVLAGHSDEVSAVAFSPDGRTLLTGSRDGSLRLWTVETGDEISVLHSPFGSPVLDATFSPDGDSILIANADGSAVILDANSDEVTAYLSGQTGFALSVAFSPDGRYALTGSNEGLARLWDVEGQLVERILPGHRDSVSSVAFSPDGRYALTGSLDGTARLWTLEADEEPRILSGHRDAVNSVAFSPDGRSMLTGSRDGTARVWDTRVSVEAREACSRVFRDFTPEERQQYAILDNAPTCPQFASNSAG